MAPKTDSQAAKTDAKSVKAGPLASEPRRLRGYEKRKFSNATEKIRKALGEETLNEDSLRALWQKAASAVEKIGLYTESIIAGSGDLDPEDNVELDYLQEVEEAWEAIRDHAHDLKIRDRLEQELEPLSAHSSESSLISGIDNTAMFSLLGMNFNIQKEVKKFDGRNVLEYKTFRCSWDAADEKLEKMKRPKAERLIYLKRVLEGEALALVANLPDDNDNYREALNLLDDFYKDN
jgi:hypothetical protein